MEEGFILDNSFGSKLVSCWVAGPPEKSLAAGTKIGGKEQRAVSTYRCPVCGYLESYAVRVVNWPVSNPV